MAATEKQLFDKKETCDALFCLNAIDLPLLDSERRSDDTNSHWHSCFTVQQPYQHWALQYCFTPLSCRTILVAPFIEIYIDLLRVFTQNCVNYIVHCYKMIDSIAGVCILGSFLLVESVSIVKVIPFGKS